MLYVKTFPKYSDLNLSSYICLSSANSAHDLRHRPRKEMSGLTQIVQRGQSHYIHTTRQGTVQLIEACDALRCHAYVMHMSTIVQITVCCLFSTKTIA